MKTKERSAPHEWNEARRILCVRLDTLGDVLMTSPAMRALKESAPGRRLSILTSSLGAEAASLTPEIDDIIVYDPPWMKATPLRPAPHLDRRMAERLSRERFDAAVIFTVYSQNPLAAAYLCYLAGIPRRLAHCRENPYQLLTEWVPEPEPHDVVRHEVRRQLDLVGAIGCATSDERLSLTLRPNARARAIRALQAAGVDLLRDWVLIHPGATAASRRYPEESFTQVASSMVNDLGWQVVFTGTAAEGELVEAIRGRMSAPSVSLAGHLSLADLAALLSMAPLLIANNTGPAHVAAAVGTPVVVLYALTNPQHTPWGVPSKVLYHDVPCRFCYRSTCPEGHHNCLRMVTPELVIQAAHDLWAETRRSLGATEGAGAERRLVDGRPVPLPVAPLGP